MGKVILKTNRGKLISLRCKSEKRASEIAAKRPDVVSFNYYEDGQIIPRVRKKIIKEETIEEKIEKFHKYGIFS